MWILVAVASYFLYAVVALVDKYLLSGPLPSPKTYAFYVGMLGGGVAIFLFAFGLVVIPEIGILTLGLLAGVMRTLFLFSLFRALQLFEASRVIPALGAVMPIFLFVFVFFTGDTTVFLAKNLFAFLLLVIGTVGITFVKSSRITVQSILGASIAAFFGGLSFFLSKFVYDDSTQTFISALAWLLVGAFLMSLVFFVFPEVQKEVAKIFSRPKKPVVASRKKFPLVLFVGNQATAAGAGLLQNFAVALVPLGLLSFVSAVGGVQYLFLLVFALFFSHSFPEVLQEKVSRPIIIQKTIAIFLISVGLFLLAL